MGPEGEALTLELPLELPVALELLVERGALPLWLAVALPAAEALALELEQQPGLCIWECQQHFELHCAGTQLELQRKLRWRRSAGHCQPRVGKQLCLTQRLLRRCQRWKWQH